MKALRLLRKATAKLRGWRTLAFNAVLGSGSAVLLFLDELKQLDLSAIVSAKVLPYITLAVSIVGILLRVYTAAPMGNRRYRDRYEHFEDDYDYGQRRNPTDARSSRRKSRHSVEPELD